MTAAVIAGAAAALAVIGLIAWLARSVVGAIRDYAAAEVARAGMAAELELARANVAAHLRALAATARERDAYKEIARDAVEEASVAVPGHGVDQLRAALGLADALSQPAPGGDRPAGDVGGLPGSPDGPAVLGDAGGTPSPAPVPHGGGIADALR